VLDALSGLEPDTLATGAGVFVTSRMRVIAQKTANDRIRRSGAPARS
jgi:hypothetical protein